MNLVGFFAGIMSLGHCSLARIHLSLDEKNYILAAAVSGVHIQLGGTAWMGSRKRRNQRASFMALRWRCLLDPRIRYNLRAPRSSVRSKSGREVDRAKIGPRQQALVIWFLFTSPSNVFSGWLFTEFKLALLPRFVDRIHPIILANLERRHTQPY